MAKKKNWTSGSDKVWDKPNGHHYILRYEKRVFRLLFVYNELRCFKLSSMETLVELIRSYKKISDGLEKQRFKFKDCEKSLTALEDLFEQISFENLFRRSGGLFDIELATFCVSRGFLPTDFFLSRDVAERVKC